MLDPTRVAGRRLRTPAGLMAASLLVGLVLSGAAFAGVGALSSGGVVHACYRKSSGVLRVSLRARCGRGEAALTWNQTGRVGPVGPVGPSGPAGTRGPAGVQGDQGPAGPSSVPSGDAAQDNGNGGAPIATPLLALSSGSTANGTSSGPLVVTQPSRLIATTGLTWLGSGSGTFDDHVDCRLVEGPVGGSMQQFGAGNSVTLINSSEYRDLTVTAGASIGPGTYDVQVQCALRGGASPGTSAEFVRGNLTAMALPK